MSKKIFNLVTGIVTGIEAISIALVTFFNPSCAIAVNTAIPIVGTAILSVCKLFVKEDK